MADSSSLDSRLLVVSMGLILDSDSRLPVIVWQQIIVDRRLRDYRLLLTVFADVAVAAVCVCQASESYAAGW